MPQGTHMRVRVVVRRVGIDVDTRKVAAVDVGRQTRVLAEARLALDGVVEVRHGRQRHWHRRGEVVWVRLARGHWPVCLVRLSAIRGEEHVLWRRRVSRVGEELRALRPLALVEWRGREEILVVGVHWGRELALGHLDRCNWSDVHRRWLLLLLRLGC